MLETNHMAILTRLKTFFRRYCRLEDRKRAAVQRRERAQRPNCPNPQKRAWGFSHKPLVCASTPTHAILMIAVMKVVLHVIWAAFLGRDPFGQLALPRIRQVSTTFTSGMARFLGGELI